MPGAVELTFRVAAGAVLGGVESGEVAEDQAEGDGPAGASVEALGGGTAGVAGRVEPGDGAAVGAECAAAGIGPGPADRAERAGVDLQGVEGRLVDGAEDAGPRAVEHGADDPASGPTTTERSFSGLLLRAARPASLLTTGPISAASRWRAFAVAAGNRASGE